MVNPVSILDAIGSAALLAALAAVLLWGRTALRPNTFIILVFVLLLRLEHDLSNVLEWAGIDASPDRYEDFFEIMLAILWGLLLYTLMQNITENNLREMAEQFHTTFEASPDAFILSNMRTMHIVDVNSSFSNYTGYGKKEAVGRNTRELGLWKDPGDWDRFFQVLGSDGIVNNMETVFLDRQGREIHGLVSARPIQLRGVPHLLTVAKDIGDLKKAQAQLTSSLKEKEVLLKEIHHRVKNNLQVISGLLNLQARFITDSRGREVYKESQNRVVTMALIHQSLYQAPDLARVDFSAYLEQLVQKLFSSYGADRRRVKLVFEVEPVELVVDTAIPCGLIVNELVTNVLKHAFVKDGGGEVRLGFRRVENEEYELIVADDGSGLPPGLHFEKPPSLGLQLVKVLAEQLGARVTIGREGGTEFRFVFREYHEAGTALV